MCKFLSVITTGNSKPIYFDLNIRAELNESNPKGFEYDSHASLAEYFGLDEDICNKYEYCPFTKVFTVDQINNKVDDSKAIEAWYKSQDFNDIMNQGLYDLNLIGCDLKGVVLPIHVDGDLYLRGCDLKGVVLPTTITGGLDLRGCKNLKGVVLPTTVNGDLDLRGCDLKDVVLPTTVNGSLDLRGCDLKGVVLPTHVGGWLDLTYCKNLKGVVLPTHVGGNLNLRGCDLKGVVLPTHVGGKIYK